MFSRMSSSYSTTSKRLVASYLFDWFIIIAIAAAGGGLNYAPTYHRPFSLLDLDISFPNVKHEQITTTTLVIVALIAPAVLITIVALALVPGKVYRQHRKRSEILRLKLWELERGLAGLCLSCATALFITQGAKNLFGKPRPHMLSVCQPDITQIASHVVGGYGQDISARWVLVDSGICTTTNKKLLDDAFRSFPSGHNSFSWSGLLYLTLFFCSKFSITFPFLPFESSSGMKNYPQATELLPLHQDSAESAEDPSKSGSISDSSHHPIDLRNRAATPPNYLLVFAFIPVAVAFYIGSTRYVQFFHHGFDIISGSLIGIFTAVFAFRWYHLPLSRGQGWAWGARSPARAFAIGVGSGAYVSDWRQENGRRKDRVRGGVDDV